MQQSFVLAWILIRIVVFLHMFIVWQLADDNGGTLASCREAKLTKQQSCFIN